MSQFLHTHDDPLGQVPLIDKYRKLDRECMLLLVAFSLTPATHHTIEEAAAILDFENTTASSVPTFCSMVNSMVEHVEGLRPQIQSRKRRMRIAELRAEIERLEALG